jgi:hypothetical protein
MALGGGVRVEGLTKLTRDLQSLGVDIDDLKDAFADIADEGARLATGFAPKRSGRLAATVRGNRAKNKAVVSAGRKAVPYAGAINYGWPAGKRVWDNSRRKSGGYPKGIRASMFMQKADEAMKPKALDTLNKNIADIIRRKGLS